MENSETIIQNICGDVAERIRACRSREVAEMLKQQLCNELTIHCKSEIVRNLMQHHIDKLINETFDNSGKNLSLMEKIDV